MVSLVVVCAKTASSSPELTALCTLSIVIVSLFTLKIINQLIFTIITNIVEKESRNLNTKNKLVIQQQNHNVMKNGAAITLIQAWVH